MTAKESARFTTNLLKALPGTQAEIARRLRREPSDGTVRRRLRKLEAEGTICCREGVWDLPGNEVATLPPINGYEFPADFDGESHELLVLRVEELEDAGVVLDSAAIETVERYVRCQQGARKASAEVIANGQYTKSKGRVYRNPAVEDQRQFMRDAQNYDDALRKLIKEAKDEAAGAGEADPFAGGPGADDAPPGESEG